MTAQHVFLGFAAIAVAVEPSVSAAVVRADAVDRDGDDAELAADPQGGG